jgi:hypothetical protein
VCCSELEKRKAGEPGRFILDNPAKYPGKDDLGIFRESPNTQVYVLVAIDLLAMAACASCKTKVCGLWQRAAVAALTPT